MLTQNPYSHVLLQNLSLNSSYYCPSSDSPIHHYHHHYSLPQTTHYSSAPPESPVSLLDFQPYSPQPHHQVPHSRSPVSTPQPPNSHNMVFSPDTVVGDHTGLLPLHHHLLLPILHPKILHS